MDNTDEHKDNSGKSKPPILPKPCLKSSSDEMEHIIPQMIVTLADDILEDDQNGNQSSPSQEISSEILSNVFPEEETKNIEISMEPLEDLPFETRNEVLSNMPNKPEAKTVESVTHSIAQRPLIIESEKSTSHSSIVETDMKSCTDSSSPESISITTMQRPLIFDGSRAQVETPPIPQEVEKFTDSTLDNTTPKYLEEESFLNEANSLPDYKFELSSSIQQPLTSHILENVNTNQDLNEIAKDNVNKGHEKKDGLQNVKKFFDSLLHESHPEKSKSGENVSPTDNISKKQSKSEKHGIKKLFSSSKSDSDIKDKNICDDDEHSKPKIESHESSKDSKYNIKRMFDSFKQDTSDQNNQIAEKKKMERSEEERKVEDSKMPHKESKSGIKKFFDSFKHEDSSVPMTQVPDDNDDNDICIKVPVTIQQTKEPLKISEACVGVEKSSDLNASSNQNESKDPAKDSKYNIKKMFDTFKQDTSAQINHIMEKRKVEKSEVEKKAEDHKTQHKEPKSGIKKFFDSFKHEDSNASLSEVPAVEDASGIAIKVLTPDQQCKNLSNISEAAIGDKEIGNLNALEVHTSSSQSASKEDKEKQKDNLHSMKKFFDSFKHEKFAHKEGDPQMCDTKTSEKNSTIKKSHSFKESLLGKPSEDSEKEHGSKKTVKKFFDSFKQEGAEIPVTSQAVKKQQAKEIKRSQSCKETTSKSIETPHGFIGFLDSLKHKKIPGHSSHNDHSEHIYDVVEKTAIPVGSSSDINSQQSSIKKASKNKEDQSGVKKIFDSFRHKEAVVKPKVCDTPKKVRMSDNVTISYDVDNEIASTSGYISEKNVSPKLQDKENIIKPILTTKVNVTVDKPLSTIQTKEPPTAMDSKTSVLNSISDNFTALKGKIFPPKEDKSCKVVTDEEIKVGAYDLQNAAKVEHPDIAIGTYRPLKDPYFENEMVSHKLEKENLTPDKVENKLSRKDCRIQSSTVESSKTSVTKVSDSDKNLKQSRSPETLYDTCCFKLAVLFSNKALEIVSDKSKTPPKKPPKPTAEAIAKARANVVSQRLREMQNKGQSVGENIPVGYDGIRFADDETESSCDYKDVDNFDYIMDYELINRYKFDNKLDSFSDPSTCSGSYYTADAVTLKDETFSDAPLETVSLGSNNSYAFYHLPSSKSESKISSPISYNSNMKHKSQISSQTANEQSKMSPNEVKKLKGSIQSPSKRVPPPLPPKPIVTPKQKGHQTQSPLSQNVEKTSQYIKGLSLSPRTKAKLSKDSAATKNRPLVVADLKETEFAIHQTNLKDSGKKAKDRKFDMVLRNQSLKEINTISSMSHHPLTSTKSSPEVLSNETNTQSLPKKITPQRPPLPSNVNYPEDKHVKKLRAAPKVPEKPKRENTSSPASVQKRTISPPRPPPPTISKLNTPPPRPPPPVSGVQSSEKSSPYQNVEKDNLLQDKLEGCISEQPSTISLEVDGHNVPSTSGEIISDALPTRSDVEFHLTSTEDLVSANESSDVTLPQHLTVTCDGHEKQSSQKEINMIPELRPSESVIIESLPKPPPRNRRIRSRTVEITKVEKVPEVNLRRSQSLSDIDIEKKTLHLKAPNEKADLKHLYTSINKNGKKSVINQSQSSSLEKLSGRPLPAPPPPPRKFRSLDRKPKEKTKCETVFRDTNENEEAGKQVRSSDFQIHPPARKKKTEHRFHSLGHDHSRFNSETRSPGEDSKMSRSLSAPLRPGRRSKQPNVEYDENANVAFPVEAEVHRSDVILDECGNEIQNLNIPSQDTIDSAKNNEIVTPNPRRKKDKNPKEKSHSSWYDESQGSGDWEIVNWNADDEMENRFVVNPKAQPRRRQSDPGKRSTRRTSKFYVDVQSETGVLPLVDKETSPLPLDCSEKSVQTSLETLSQGMTSRDEGDDDTDELLDLAQTLQNELKVIINRHKSTSDAGNNSSDLNTPVLSGTESEDKNLGVDSHNLKKSPSTRSSNSELWPLTSSEESDSEMPPSGTVNLTEIALKRKEKKIFYIAQEIMTSEEVFVDTLKLLNVDFKAAVESANQQKGTAVVPDEVLSQILNHLPQLQHLNENLLMELKDRIENWNKVGKIADIIVKMGPFLKLYSWFIHDFEYNLSLLEDSKKKYPLFAQVVKDFEASARCKRLALNHFMLKPIQRIPQYRLLLQEYLHHLPEEHVDYQDTVAALHIVSEVATHANDSMKHGDNAQKLISIQNSIMGHKEIIKPGRLFVREGELMKLSRKGMQPRWFVLFNDLLLYLTPVQQGLYRVNHELPLTGMKVAIPIQQDYQNEFSIISVARSFTLAARSPEERQEWIIALTKAIEENASKRSTFTNIRLQQKAQEKAAEEEGEFILGRKAPVWIPDSRVTMCQLCTSEFTVTFRRHHCRACGKVVCSICSSNRISLPYLGNRIARVCDDCHLKLGPGSGTCTESGETDSDNQQIAIKPHLRTENRHIKKGKRNLPSVLKEVCANDQGSTISGYLQKKSGKSWKRDWFVVKDKVLYEYRASEDVAALKSLPLLGYQIEPFSESYENIDPSLLFQLTHPGQAPIVFHADSVGSTERWISALKDASVLE